MLRTTTIPGSNSGSERKKNPEGGFFIYLQEINNELGQGCMKPMQSFQPIVLINIRIPPFCTK